MNRTPLHGAPPASTRGSPASSTLTSRFASPQASRSTMPVFSNQDARSSYAVQPAANAGSFKLKKNAVKIVGTGSPAPATSPTPVARVSLPTSPSPASVLAKSKEPEAHVAAAEPVKLPNSPATTQSSIISFVETGSTTESIDELYARLMGTPRPSPALASSASTAKPEAINIPTTETNRRVKDGPIDPSEPKAPAHAGVPMPTSLAPAQADGETRGLSTPQASQIAVPGTGENVRAVQVQDAQAKQLSQNEIEIMYMQRARQYISMLPGGENTSSGKIRTVTQTLHDIFANGTVPNFANGSDSRFATDLVNQTLQDNSGDFLQLITALVEKGAISLSNIDDVLGLQQFILDNLRSVEPPTSADNGSVSKKDTPTTEVNHPAEVLRTWPSQEKRETSAEYRTCVLKGVAGLTSFNQLQALVWGGRVESLRLPAVGSSSAIVKFITAEGCQNYYQATENGIVIGDDRKKVVITVEKTEGPNSSNDVIKAVAEGNATRCIQAIGADEVVSETQLLKFARGTAQRKRDIDRIKRGKNKGGHYYVEFRFANILDSINFYRELRNDEDWEHCNTRYAADPCETAHGVHFEDEAE